MTTATLPPPPRQTANPAPVRPENSLRRTTSIDVSWPDGEKGERLMVGRARDLLTGQAGSAGTVRAQGEFRARLAEDKTITAITAQPPHPGIETLVGERGGNHLRVVLRERLPDLIAQVDPLYLVLDDISGTALVSAFAWSQWYPDWATRIRDALPEEEFARMMESRKNVCWGLAEGNSGMHPDGPQHSVADADAGELRNPADPQGWHDFDESDGPGFRRARRIDVTLDAAAGLIRIDSAFQDSARTKTGGRVAIHEYLLAATADAATLELRSITPEGRILPFSECPGAIANAQLLVGRNLADIRAEVLANLRGTAGCTHLNDALRALADVPALAESLREAA